MLSTGITGFHVLIVLGLVLIVIVVVLVVSLLLRANSRLSRRDDAPGGDSHQQ